MKTEIKNITQKKNATYTLNQSQDEALQHIVNFIQNDSNIFILKGYAGTGKTTIIKELIKNIRKNELPFLQMAPTGRAAKVLSERTGNLAYTIHKSIYSMTDMIEYKIQNEAGSESFKYYFQIRVNNNVNNQIYIIDEASMVSNQYSEGEFFRFGSGHLLNDLLYFTRISSQSNSKIIFIGDSAQLPPVNMNLSPALDKNYLNALSTKLKIEEFTLTEIERQEKDSGIVSISSEIRKSIEKQIYNKFYINTNQNKVRKIDFDNLIEKYLTSCNNKIDDETILITFSNNSVNNYNKLIRQQFFPGRKNIVKGDRILIVQNNYSHEIEMLNGDFGYIVYIEPIPEKRTITFKSNQKKITVTLIFLDVVIRLKRNTDKYIDVKCKILENLLDSSNGNLTSEEFRALYVDFKKRNHGLKPQTEAFKEAIKTDAYFNAIRVKYGYAVTCHKAQGGEWKNVFVDFGTNMGVLNQFYFRWAYTAITRSKNILFCLNTPKQNILDNIHIINTKRVEKQQEKFVIWNFKEYIKDMIDSKNFCLKNIENLQYCKRCYFEQDNHSIQVDIYYNKKGEITNILSHENLNENINKNIYKNLSRLKGKYISTQKQNNDRRPINRSEIYFPNDKPFLKDFYNEIKAKLNKSGINIVKLAHNNYQEKYTFRKNNDMAVVDFYYNGKGKFGKCVVEQKMDNSMLNNIISTFKGI